MIGASSKAIIKSHCQKPLSKAIVKRYGLPVMCVKSLLHQITMSITISIHYDSLQAGQFLPQSR